MYSILYKKSNPSQSQLHIDEGLLENYLSPLAGFFNNRENEKRYFVSVLENPLSSADEIYYRQEIFQDFLQNPAFLQKLSQYTTKIISLYKENLETKQRMTASRIVQGYALTEMDKFHSNFAMMQEECITFCSLVIQFSELLKELKQKEPHSVGLKKLLNYIEKYSIENESVLTAAETCKFLSDLTESEFLKYSNITVQHVEDLQFAFSDISYSEEPSIKSIFAKNLHPEKEYKILLSRSCEILRTQIKKISENGFSFILNLDKELKFYRIGCTLKEAMDSHKIPYTFPSESSQYDIKDLYDLRLQMSLGSTPMDTRSFSLNKAYCLITGMNNSGKTVFLRSLLIAQVFGQSGLFVPASSAKIPFFAKIFVLFATEESCNPMGRFEHEVLKMSEVNNNAESKNTIVFLNEMFQSAPYAEAQEALSFILESWKKRTIHWITVTHLDLQHLINNEKDINHIHFTKEY